MEPDNGGYNSRTYVLARSEDCTVMIQRPYNRYSYQWDDINCGIRKNFVCKKGKTSDTIISELYSVKKKLFLQQSTHLKATDWVFYAGKVCHVCCNF